ncbi:MAG: hypothetical protein CMF72_00870 [Mameliella sp.]|nr:hypothetical protein [Mameliella sp.]
MFSSIYLLKDRHLFWKERRKALADPAGWRQKHPLRETDTDLLVSYFVPIFERRRAPDWEIVQTNLLRTVAALRRQTDARWRMVICSQDRPDRIDFDSRVQFLKYPVSHGGEPDKLHKLRFMARHFANTERRDGYVFFLDGDDIPHPGLTQFILEDNNGHGYFLPLGYCYDRRNRTLLSPTQNTGDIHTFAWHCGSSHAVRFDTRQGKEQTVHVSLRGSHMEARQNLQDRTRLTLSPVPFPAMIYLINHGSSDQDILAQSDGRQRAARGLVPESQDQTKLIQKEFGLSSENLDG